MPRLERRPAMRLRLLVCLPVLAAVAPGLARASTVPDSLSLGSLVGVFPTGAASPFSSFSTASFNAANVPYSNGQTGMLVTFGAAAMPSVTASGADGGNLTGYDNTPATVTLAASGNALVSSGTVPEPATLALVSVGLLGLLAARRRRT